MEEGYPEVLRRTIESVMTRNPLTILPTTRILEAASFMGRKNFRRIPVTENGKLLGMVSIGDINRGLFSLEDFSAPNRDKSPGYIPVIV